MLVARHDDDDDLILNIAIIKRYVQSIDFTYISIWLFFFLLVSF